MQANSTFLRPSSYIGLAATAGLLSTLALAAIPPREAGRVAAAAAAKSLDIAGDSAFRQQIQPLLKTYCYGCHSGSAPAGNVAFDALGSSMTSGPNRILFGKVLKNLRSGTMPPSDMDQPTAAEKSVFAQWVKGHVFEIDPTNPDPGRVTVRRLNRVEYRNTVRDLLGVDFDTQTEFPPDDAGHGFDNIGDVLTISPMLMEKYLNAAQTIVAEAVPTTSRVVAETVIPGVSFLPDGLAAGSTTDSVVTGSYRALSYYEPAVVSHTLQVTHPGAYEIDLDLAANEKYVDDQFDYNRCRLIVRSDGEEMLRKDLNREGGKPLHYTFARKWESGGHRITFDLQPLTPGVEKVRSLTLRINKVIVRGPSDPTYRVEPDRYKTFFPRPVPPGGAARLAYAHEILAGFARRAFRRPADDTTVSRLASLAQSVYTQPGQTFEAGVAQAMTAVLASPQFLFREESIAPGQNNRPFARIDEYALASRLSYFLWSSMPDDTLFRLASQGALRQNLGAQVQRMLRDPRSEALIDNFSGQWLQTRDIEKVPIDPRAVMQREIDPATPPPTGAAGYRRFRPRVPFDDALRKDLRRETDLYFGHVVHDDRSVLELIDSNYTFLDERLAKYYGITDPTLTGDAFRQVTLPADSPRGGVLTMGSVLAVTSNPTRTSPVKRGLFILDNILGAPAPPPPPNIPALEAAAAGFKDHQPTVREILAVHRDKPACASCHNRLDPPGLALENFNAMGVWRTKEFGQPVTGQGTLVTGEPFKDVRGLKQILVSRHSTEFYRCLTEKLLTYALGRGLEDYDTESVDRIVQRLQKDQGRFSSLLTGVIESAPFQKSRNPTGTTAAVLSHKTQFSPNRKAAPRTSG